MNVVVFTLIPLAASHGALSQWSAGQVWCSPDRHGAVIRVFKNQIVSGSLKRTQPHLRTQEMMQNGMMNSGMMWNMSLVGLFTVVLLVLGIAALVKYLFRGV